jgi:sugar O-acyltransferase (sialic acid O-acetyltransferase NeuD family)
MIIAGAGGHAREIYMLLDAETRNAVCFFDNYMANTPADIYQKPVLTSEAAVKDQLQNDPHFIIGTGSPATRRKLCELLVGWGGIPITMQAATAFISDSDTIIGEGANLMHDVFISTDVSVGRGCLVNTRAQLHHDVKTGDFCEIGPAALLLGRVIFGNNVFIGAGAIVLPGLHVADGAIIGAGAVVTTNIIADQVVKGNPAK